MMYLEDRLNQTVDLVVKASTAVKMVRVNANSAYEVFTTTKKKKHQLKTVKRVK